MPPLYDVESNPIFLLALCILSTPVAKWNITLIVSSIFSCKSCTLYILQIFLSRLLKLIAKQSGQFHAQFIIQYPCIFNQCCLHRQTNYIFATMKGIRNGDSILYGRLQRTHDLKRVLANTIIVIDQSLRQWATTRRLLMKIIDCRGRDLWQKLDHQFSNFYSIVA